MARTMAARFTDKQGQYLSFIYYYTKVSGRPPAEADMQRYFAVAPPSVHQMVLTLESKGLIERTPGLGRSIRLRIGRGELPDLNDVAPVVLALTVVRPNAGQTDDVSSQLFGRQAKRLWERIPEEFRKTLLANVWCGNCAGGTTIVQFHGEVEGGDLILRGVCSRCGSQVARHIESS
jgi:repressor LexA